MMSWNRGVVALLCGLGCACAHDPLPSMQHGEALAHGHVSVAPVIGHPHPHDPWDSVLYPPLDVSVSTPDPDRRAIDAGPLQATAWLWFRAYQGTFSRVDGATCRFRPTCSRLGFEAVERHGVRGFAIGFARLARAHAGEHVYPTTDPPYLDDPLSNYTFSARRPRLDDFGAYDDEAHAWFQHVRATRRLQQ